MSEWKRILVFCAHPDDEIIGCGGTLAKHSRQGADITVAMFTQGETGYTDPSEKDGFLQVREQERDRYDHMLGIGKRIILGKPCQGVCNDRPTYHECISIVRQVRPQVVLTHNPTDRHRDHRTVSEVTTEACWKASEAVLADLGEPWYTPQILFFEVFQLFPEPSLIVDITETFASKQEAMETQTSQLRVLKGIPSYLEGLAMARGHLGQCKYAEAFLRSNVLATRQK